MKIKMKTYRMTLKRMMMTVLMMLITVSAMSAEQKIWLHISGNGKAQVSLDGKTLELDKDNMATVKDAAGLKVAVSVKPDDGYTVTSVTAQLTTDAGNADTRGADDASFLEVTKSGSDYIFTMPEAGYNVVINVTFESTKKEGEPTRNPDYSGIYYIGVYGSKTTSQCASDNPADNYYLCPTEGWCYYAGTNQVTGDDNGQPFLTSFQCRNGVYDATKAVWEITKHPTEDYYYIQQKKTGKYLVFNVQLNGAGANRARVHLETITSPATPDDYALFAISTVTTTDDRNGYWVFHPKKADSSYYLNITNGNVNSVSTPTGGKTDGPTGYGNVDGIIGQWNQQNNTSSFYLEKYSPFITFNASNQVVITTASSSATLVYTTDGTTPAISPSNGTVVNTNTVSFDPADEVTTIKAIAIENGEESAVATFTPLFFLGSTHPRLIQSQHYNTDKVTWTEPCYYMIPGDVSSENMTVNTTTLLQPTMEWYFLNAGKDDLSGNYSNQYYYIVNSNGKNLCYDSTNGVHLETNSDNADKFKFSIAPYPATGTPTDYNLVLYGLTTGNRFINKNSGNDNVLALNLASTNSASASRWKFVKKADLPTTLPFSVSDNSNTYYYKLSTNATPTAFITPPTSGNYVTTNATESTSQNWYFEQAEAATLSDWLTYYHIRNAITGEYLYYNGEVNSSTHTNAFELHSSIDNNNADRYKFAMARATVQDRWYIVPKVLKETQLANISTIWRDNNNALKTQATRNNGNAMWQFTSSDFCMPPVFEESGENIIITCPTKGDNIEIHYTTDGTVPTSSSTLYNNDLSSSTQQIITAIAILKSGETVKATSTHSTLFNKPDIILKEGENVVGENTYTYDGSKKTPTPSKVSIGETEITSGYAVTYENNINAGTATLILTDDNTTDNWYIMNASKTFTIGQLEAVLAWSNTTLAYDGNPKAPTVTVSNLVEGDVCTVTLTIDGENATETEDVKTAVNVGSYTATATALSNANYKLPTDEADRKCDFTIASSIVFSISINGWTYGGSPNDPVATGNDNRTVTYAYKVKDAADVTYSETVPTKAGNYTVKGTIAAEGDYAESVATADFTIAAKSLSTGTDPNFTPADGITIDIDRDDEGVYTITLKDGETALVAGTEGTEYDYSKSINDTDSNFGIVTVTGANNYTGSFTSTYAKVAFTKPEEAGGGFAEAGLFDIPESSSIGDTATPAGLEAYIVVGINDDRTVEIEKLDYIPEGVPVLLLSNNEVSNGFTIMPRNGGTAITTEQKTSNKLKKASGTDEERHVDFATIYLLYRGEFVLNIAGTLPEGKIYLDAGGPSSGTRSSRLPIARGYSTGIKGVEDNEKTEIQDGRWYSLDGRRFTEKPTKKGIYLREGKKVVIK